MSFVTENNSTDPFVFGFFSFLVTLVTKLKNAAYHKYIFIIYSFWYDDDDVGLNILTTKT